MNDATHIDSMGFDLSGIVILNLPCSGVGVLHDPANG